MPERTPEQEAARRAALEAAALTQQREGWILAWREHLLQSAAYLAWLAEYPTDPQAELWQRRADYHVQQAATLATRLKEAT